MIILLHTILLLLTYAWYSQQGDVIYSSFRDQQIIDIKYVNKQTNNMYINKQTKAKAGFSQKSIKNLSMWRWHLETSSTI